MSEKSDRDYDWISAAPKESLDKPDQDMTRRIEQWDDPPLEKETSLWTGLLALIVIYAIGVLSGLWISGRWP